MIRIRQGKAKTILENSRNSALTAVESYNRPRNAFRVENYIVLMIIAWTKLFHAYFQATIGEKYFYKERNGRYKLVDGERKAWELKQCIKQYRKIKREHPLEEAVVANLHFFIGLRNKIEHKYWDNSELDLLLFGECQSLLYNYENMIVGLFGDEFSINTSLAYALQFSHMRTKGQIVSQRRLLSKDMQDIKRYVEKYKFDLSQEIYDSQEFSIKLLQIPKVSNTNRSELSIEYVDWNSLDERDKDNYNKVTTIIKDKLVVRNVSNARLLKPNGVVDAVKERTGKEFTINKHTALWKAFCVRPSNACSEDERFETIEKYCVYDEPHNDYLYTEEWIDFIVNLFERYDFSSDNILRRCKTSLKIEDYC